MSLVCPFLRDRLSCCYYKTRLLSSRTMRFVLELFCDTVVLNLQKCILDGITYSFPILGSCMSPQVLLRLVSHGACSLHSTCPVLTMICLRLYLVQEIRNSIDEPCYTVWLKRSNLCASMRFSAHVPLKKFKLIFSIWLHQQCLTCSEVALNEAVSQMSPCDAWSTALSRLFGCIDR